MLALRNAYCDLNVLALLSLELSPFSKEPRSRTVVRRCDDPVEWLNRVALQ